MNTINNNITPLKDDELDCVQGGSAIMVVGAITLAAAVTTTAAVIIGNAVALGMKLWKSIKNSK